MKTWIQTLAIVSGLVAFGTLSSCTAIVETPDTVGASTTTTTYGTPTIGTTTTTQRRVTTY